MNPGLEKYISSARAKGHADERIKKDLIAAGWDADMVDAGIGGDDLDVPPPPPPGSLAASADTTPSAASGRVTGTDNAVKIVAAKTTAGLEYPIMFLSLWVAATALAAILHSAIDRAYGLQSIYSSLSSISTAALIVALPIFIWLFLYLKKKEIVHPEIRRDLNRKGAVQLTLLVTFAIGVGKLIIYVYGLLNSQTDGTPFLANLLHTIITLGVAGSIFAYYWYDEHKPDPS